MSNASFDDFIKMDLRIGTIIDVQSFPEARKSAWKLTIDFGPDLGTKQSSAQITALYAPNELLGQQVIGVVNIPPRQIGPFTSEVLTLGFTDELKNVVLATAERKVPNGSRLF